MNTMSIVNSLGEDQKTMQTMAYNFDHGYDGDPTPEQEQEFEHSRKSIVKEKYLKALSKKELEEETWKLAVENEDVKKTLQDIEFFHSNQFRKVGGAPYVEHPLAVAKIVSRFSYDTELLQASLLHDVIEDVENGRELLFTKYSQEVINLVNSVSEQDKSLPWEQRKRIYIQHLQEVGYETLLLSLADRTQNLRDMIESFEKYGSDLWKKFNAGVEKQKWFVLSYSLAVKSEIDKLDNPQQKLKLLDLYDEYSSLAGYFLGLVNENKE